MYSSIHDFWVSTDVPHNFIGLLTTLTHILLAVVISVLVYLLCRKVISPLITRFVKYTPIKWDDIVFSRSMLRAMSFVVFAYVLNVILPPACQDYKWLYAIIDRACPILLVIAMVRLVNRGFKACYLLLGENQTFRVHPLKGLLQMLQLIAIIVGIIISVSIILDKNPVLILSGLGASAAIMMLVFKDSILGVVAGVQLSANDMLKKGDWIVVPNTPVNGVVQDVTLTTVKVQNFDNTTLTVPPYTLVSGAFQNYRGMYESGGRRIMRSVMIDVRTIRFCTDDEVEAYKKESWYDAVPKDIDANPVNLTVFRCYLEDFVTKYSLTNTHYTIMVRQLQPTNYGVPLELYAFTKVTAWKDYEHVQSDIFSHIYAVIGRFGLRIYQTPGAEDLERLASTPSAAAATVAQEITTPQQSDGTGK